MILLHRHGKYCLRVIDKIAFATLAVLLVAALVL
jgi:hypothetical protein